MSEWQPIETAPKEEGHWIIVWDADYELPMVVHWWGGLELVNGQWEPNEFGEWSADLRMKDRGPNSTSPTHWMPLPAPPEDVDASS
jgi:hypothetical protein